MPEDGVVYVVDDDESIRKALRRLFQAAGFKVETYSSATEFMQIETTEVPSCLVLDVHLPEISGIELQKDLLHSHADLPIVFITGDGDIPMSVQAMKAGAADFLPKPVDDTRLLDAVRSAMNSQMIGHQQKLEIAEFVSRIESLTVREKQVLELVVDGQLNKQIARRLEISEATVKVHRGRMMEKSGVDSVAELSRMCERARNLENNR